MKKLITKLSMIVLAGLFCFGPCACNVISEDATKDTEKNKEEVQHGDYSTYTKLVIDGGSQNAAYNSTVSLEYDKYSNPYPYNTLEKLAEEWNAAHASEYGYYFSVASSSINNDRETMLPMLAQGTAPEIIFYLGTTIAEDQNKGYFYDLKEAMELPNKYSKEGEAGSAHWKDLYPSDLYSSFFSPDGQLFNVNLEQNPIGLLYNKTLFDAAGIQTLPTTYKEFMEAQDKLNAYAKTVNRADTSRDDTYLCPYYRMFNWYDSVLETTLMGDIMSSLDVIRPDGCLDAEEFTRGYYVNTDGDLVSQSENKTRIYSPDDDRMVELYRLIKQMCKYYPDNKGYYAEQSFIAGNIAMLEVTGGDMRNFIDMVDGRFEIGVMPYPVLTHQPENEPQNDYYTSYNVGGYSVQRGLSGYSTGWAISNAAMNKDAAAGNTKCVDACIDFLMFVSCFENNDRLVNDRGFAIPLSGNTTYDLFKGLADVFKEDRDNEKALSWAAATAGGAMNKNYYDACILFRDDLLINDKPIKEQLSTLVTSFATSANQLAKQNKWVPADWTKYGKENA